MGQKTIIIMICIIEFPHKFHKLNIKIEIILILSINPDKALLPLN